MSEENSPKPRVDSTLSKGLAILEQLAQSNGGKGVSELSRELELTKSNTFRLLQTLVTLGYVKHGENKQYSATLKAWRVGRHTLDNLNLRELAAEEMQMLSRETEETIYLAVPEGQQVIYIDKIDSQKPIRSWSSISASAPLHCVATGKAILAVDYEARRGSLKGSLKRYTEKTLTNMVAMDADIEETIRRGYAYDCGEYRERILSLGAAITLSNNEVIAALGVSLPDINLKPGGVEAIGLLVAEAARSVSAKLSRV